MVRRPRVPDPPPPQQTQESAAVQRTVEDERKLLAKSRGRGSTIRTLLSEDVSATTTKTLLGE